MNGDVASIVLGRMLKIVDVVEKAKWFPPEAFNLVAWAHACDVSDATVRRWAAKAGAAVVKTPGGKEEYIAVSDFWPAMEYATNEQETPEPAKPKRSRRR